MQKQINRIDEKIKKCDKGIERVLNGEFSKTGRYILPFLNKREQILEETKRKIIKLNKQSLINFSL